MREQQQPLCRRTEDQQLHGGRQDSHECDGDDAPGQQPQRQADRNQVESEEAATLLFLIGNIDGGDQPAYAARRAPERQQQARYGREAKRAARRLHQIVQLLGKKFLRLLRQNPREDRHLPLDLSGIENEPVKRNERRQAWEQRQQDRVGHSARDQEEVLIGDFTPGAPQDVLPAARGISPG